MIFLEIPYNLLLLGCKSWVFRQSLLNNLEVFLHRKIRRILGINTTKVRDQRINNTSIRIMFYNIPCIQNQVAFRQLSYIGKIFQREGYHLPTQLLTDWCNHLRKCGWPLLTNKLSLARIISLIIPGVDETGSTSFWGYHTLNTGHWRDLIATLKHPANTTPYSPQNIPDADADVPPRLKL